MFRVPNMLKTNLQQCSNQAPTMLKKQRMCSKHAPMLQGCSKRQPGPSNGGWDLFRFPLTGTRILPFKGKGLPNIHFPASTSQRVSSMLVCFMLQTQSTCLPSKLLTRACMSAKACQRRALLIESSLTSKSKSPSQLQSALSNYDSEGLRTALVKILDATRTAFVKVGRNRLYHCRGTIRSG